VSTSVVRLLVLKDLFLVRWMILGSLVAGALCLAVMTHGRVAGYVGGISFICVLVILNIFLVMVGIVQERKDKVLLFVLSLPISTTQYVQAKVLANVIAFAVPWLVLTVAAVGVMAASPIPDGLIPFWLTVLVYLFAYYLVLLGVALLTDSTGGHAAAITVGNLSVNFVIPFLLRLPSIADHLGDSTPVWSADVLAMIGVEFLVGVAALALAIWIRSRRTDHV